MQKDVISVTSMDGRYYKRLPLNNESNVADKGVVNNFVDRFPIVLAPLSGSSNCIERSFFEIRHNF